MSFSPVIRMIRYAILLICLSVAVTKADIFSSTAQLQNLLHFEKHIVTTLHNYIERTESKLNQVRRYLNLFYDSYQNVLEAKIPTLGDADEIVLNPLQAYQLIRRLAVDWDFVRSAMNTDDWHPIRRLTQDYKQLMPTQEDLQGAAMALIRLQDTYRINMSDFSKGNLLGMPQGTSLSARDLLYLGKQSFSAGYYVHAIQWLEEALYLAHRENNRTASPAEIMTFHASTVDKHDQLFEKKDIDVNEYITFGHPLKGNMSVHSSVMPTTRKKLRLGNDISFDEENQNYMALCRGERLLSIAEESKLVCRLETRNDTYLILMPLKVEIRSLKPYVVQFHDLLTDSQTNILRQTAEPKLSRAQVVGTENSQIVSGDRTSQNAWIDPRDHPLTEKIYKLVQTVTGLSTDVERWHAEVMQIANYGVGGHYVPHPDYLLADLDEEELKHVPPKELDAGDRIATLMFYLSDVAKGGATVFPKAGGSVWPRKGSAVFWYNLKRNGKEDSMTLHGACPVVHGSKWVANCWIHEKGQVFRRQCALDPEL